MSARRITSVFAFLSLAIAAPAVAKNYSPAKVIQAMKVNNQRLRIIVEHRGRFYQDCPENSVCAMNATTREGVEAVEIDVRESADGTLWPIHDTNIGRTTNFSADGHLFNPYTRSAANERNNPAIHDLHDATLRSLKLRDPLGHVTGDAFQPLDAMMHKVDVGNRNLVYMFDIKTRPAIAKTAAMVRRLGLQDRAILKFNSTLVSPGTVLSETHGINFVPVIGTGSLDQIVDHYHLEKTSPSERVAAYVNDFAKTAGFVYFEVRNKMFTGPRSGSAFDTKVEGPLSQIDFYMALTHIPQGGYAPYTEHYATPSQPGTGYYYVDGHCCQLLTDNHDRSGYFGIDSRDDREVLHYMVSYNAVTISDIAAAAMSEARQMGARADEFRLYY